MPVQTQKKQITRRTFLKYTGLFVLMCVVIYATFALQGKTFIWDGDGFHQHYPFFREYLTIIRQFFETGEWQNWDWNIGLGQDTLVTYGYYVVGDPFVYLGLLFPQGSEELAFHVIMFVRIWSVGASFLLYARKMTFSERSALAGSIMYGFSHFVIYNVVRHPFFIHPLIFFPLLCLGVEKVFRKESGVLFSVMVAISAASNFYFFYMLTWMIFLYALVRYRSLVATKDWKTFFKWFAYFVGLYLLGLLISAMIFLPLVFGFLSASRSAGLPPISMLVYPLYYYGLLIINSISPGTIFWAVGGFSILGIFSLPFLIKRRRKRPALFWALAILGILLLFPFFGSLMNGLSGPYNRFTFVLPFYIALTTAFFIDHSHDLSGTDLTWMRRLMIFFTIIYTGASVVRSMYLFYLTPVVFGWGLYLGIQARADKRLTLAAFQRLMIGFVAVNMTLNALLFYLPIGKNAMSPMEDAGTIDENYANIFEGVEKHLPDDEWYRTGVSSMDNNVRNQYAYINTPGTNSYSSLTNGDVAEFSRVMESVQYQVIQPLRNGIDDRRIVNQALGVKYMITDEENAAYLPSDYTVNSDLSAESDNMIVVETENEAPFAYVENDSVMRAALEDMHPVERENLLAEAVILEEKNNNADAWSGDSTLTIHEGEWDVPFSLNEPMDIRIEEENTQITLTFDQPEALMNQEVFLYLEGIDYQQPETLPGIPDDSSYRINVNYNDQEKTALQSDRYTFSSYFKRENILFHLNEVTTPEGTLTLEFESPGHYSFDNVSVVSRPYNEDRAAMLAQEKDEQALTIETFSNEYIQGNIDVAESGTLVTSIPYSPGWEVLVDGEEVATEKVNVGFVGMPISAGEHTVEFVYQTPFLTLGAILTGVGLIILGGYALVFRRKMK